MATMAAVVMATVASVVKGNESPPNYKDSDENLQSSTTKNNNDNHSNATITSKNNESDIRNDLNIDNNNENNNSTNGKTKSDKMLNPDMPENHSIEMKSVRFAANEWMNDQVKVGEKKDGTGSSVKEFIHIPPEISIITRVGSVLNEKKGRFVVVMP